MFTWRRRFEVSKILRAAVKNVRQCDYADSVDSELNAVAHVEVPVVQPVGIPGVHCHPTASCIALPTMSWCGEKALFY